jgi:hypothetical protein
LILAIAKIFVAIVVVAEFVGLIAYGALVQRQRGLTPLDLAISGAAIGIAVVLFLIVAALERRGTIKKRDRERAAAVALKQAAVEVPAKRASPARPDAPQMPVRPIRSVAPVAPAAPVPAAPIARWRDVTRPDPKTTLIGLNEVRARPAEPVASIGEAVPEAVAAEPAAPAPAPAAAPVRSRPLLSASTYAALRDEIADTDPTDLEWIVPPEAAGIPVDALPADEPGTHPFFTLPAPVPVETLADREPAVDEPAQGAEVVDIRMAALTLVPRVELEAAPEPATVPDPEAVPEQEVVTGPFAVIEPADLAGPVEELTDAGPEEDLSRYREAAVSLIDSYMPEPEPIVETAVSELDALIRAVDLLKLDDVAPPASTTSVADRVGDAVELPARAVEAARRPAARRPRLLRRRSRVRLDMDSDELASLLRALEQGKTDDAPTQAGLTVIEGGRSLSRAK